MASQSPSEFLTFYRRTATSQVLRRATSVRRPGFRAFASSLPNSTGNPNFISDKGTHQDTAQGKKEHVVNKGKDDTNVQTSASQAGRDRKQEGTGGAATSQTDDTNSKAKAQKEFPNAPDVAIGMQDERGGKGV